MLTPTFPSPAFSEAFFLTHRCPKDLHIQKHTCTHTCLSLCSDAWKAVLASSYSLSHKEGLSLRSMLRESQLYFQQLTVVSGFVTFSYLAAENGYREEVQLLTVLFKSISNVPHWAVTCVFPFFKKKKKASSHHKGSISPTSSSLKASHYYCMGKGCKHWRCYLCFSLH